MVSPHDRSRVRHRTPGLPQGPFQALFPTMCQAAWATRQFSQRTSGIGETPALVQTHDGLSLSSFRVLLAFFSRSLALSLSHPCTLRNRLLSLYSTPPPTMNFSRQISGPVQGHSRPPAHQDILASTAYTIRFSYDGGFSSTSRARHSAGRSNRPACRTFNLDFAVRTTTGWSSALDLGPIKRGGGATLMCQPQVWGLRGDGIFRRFH